MLDTSLSKSQVKSKLLELVKALSTTVPNEVLTEAIQELLQERIGSQGKASCLLAIKERDDLIYSVQMQNIQIRCALQSCVALLKQNAICVPNEVQKAFLPYEMKQYALVR